MRAVAVSALGIVFLAGHSHAAPLFLTAAERKAQGFGFLVDRECFVVTAAHFVKQTKDGVLAYTEQGVRFELVVAHVDADWDVALLRGATRKIGLLPPTRRISKTPGLGAVCGDEAARGHYAPSGFGSFVGQDEYRGTDLRVFRVFGIAGEERGTPVRLEELDARGNVFWIAPRGPERILQGFSGALVWTVSQGSKRSPVGMVTHVAANGRVRVVHLRKIEDVAVSLLAPLHEITISPEVYTIRRITRGAISSYLPNIFADRRTRALALEVDSGEKHLVVSGFRLLCSGGCKISVAVEVSVDKRSWKRAQLSKPKLREFRLYDVRSALALRFELLGEISRLRGIEIDVAD